MPSYGYGMKINGKEEVPREGYRTRTISFGTESIIDDTSIQDDTVDLNQATGIYEIAKYDEANNKYTYINGLEHCNLPELTLMDVQEIEHLVRRGAA